MNVSIDHPSNKPNYTHVEINDLIIVFSYRTPIAFHTYEGGWIYRENDWGPTTGRHLTMAGSNRKHERLPSGDFESALEEVTR